MKLILGSQSASRRQVLEEAGMEFDVMPADIDEKAIRSEDYEQLPLMIAKAKAEALLGRVGTDVILITSDQVVECAGELREKPESEDEARRFIASYASEPAQTNSAVVVTNTATGKQVSGVDIAKAYFKPIPDSVVDELIADGAIMTSAGAFIIEHPLMAPYVDRIEGTPDSVQGMPLALTQELIRQVS